MNKLLEHVETLALGRYRIKPEFPSCWPISIECDHDLVARPEFARQEEYLIRLQFGYRAFCEADNDRDYAKKAFFRYLKNELYGCIRSLTNELAMAICELDVDALKGILGKIRDEIDD